MLPRRRLTLPKTISLRGNKLMVDTPLFVVGYVIGVLLVQLQLTDRKNSSKFKLDCLAQAQKNGLASLGLNDTRHTAKVKYFDIPRDLDPTMMIGVMTTKENLATRAAAIYKTWGKRLPGLLVFYMGEKGGVSSGSEKKGVKKGQKFQASEAGALKLSRNERIEVIQGMPVVRLKGISDSSYPPQVKCFAMLAHLQQTMSKFNFHWYIRADDDVYIKTDKLAKYLNSVRTGKQHWYIGQPGTGIPAERGKLGLDHNLPYCMGGPGVVFNPTALRDLMPHLPECAQSVVTSHEDTELGRCILQHLKIPCTQNHKKMSKLFFNDYEKIAFTQTTLPRGPLDALTLHPIKDPRLMHRVHAMLMTYDVYHVQNKMKELKLNIEYFTIAKGETPRLVATNPTYNRPRIVDDFINGKKDTISWWNSRIKGASSSSKTSSLAGAATNFTSLKQEILGDCHPVFAFGRLPWHGGYEYLGIYPHNSRYHSIHQAAYVVYRQYLKIRPQLRYMSNVNPVYGVQFHMGVQFSKSKRNFLLSYRFQDLDWMELSEQAHYVDGKQTKSQKLTPKWPPLYILVPLYGRHYTFSRFLQHLTAAAKRYPAPVYLHVAVFHDKKGESQQSLKAITHVDKVIKVKVIEMKNVTFSRALALHALATAGNFNYNDILVMLDVDLVLNEDFLRRVAVNTRKGAAYFPIMFSKYWPKTVCYWSKGRKCTPKLYDFSDYSGFWRDFGFGQTALIAGDYKKTTGFNTRIVGWGKEDTDFHDRCLKHGISIFRANDIGLLHEYHEKYCDPKLRRDQRGMCWFSKLSTVGSVSRNSQIAYKEKLIYRERYSSRRHR